MQPLKSFAPQAKTLLRITAAILIGSLYFDRLTNPDLTYVYWFISVVIVIFAFLLLISGFIKNAAEGHPYNWQVIGEIEDHELS